MFQMSAESTAGLGSTWWKSQWESDTRKRVDQMWVRVHLTIVMCSPGLLEEWPGLSSSVWLS